ncbi:MAG: homocysteine S-methyltransferase family protein [Actinobacteria bacterium]|nr:MAG: homocysteine S-methyltransferase family protein [Actinomycetota bacterium]
MTTGRREGHPSTHSSIDSIPRPEEVHVSKGIMERLAEGPVLGDGGYLLELVKRGYVQAGPFTPEVVIDHPDALAQLHREFLRAGAEVLQTMTFYARRQGHGAVAVSGRCVRLGRVLGLSVVRRPRTRACDHLRGSNFRRQVTMGRRGTVRAVALLHTLGPSSRGG